MFSLQLAETTHVHATPWHIWKQVSGLSGYANWNAFIPRAEGRVEEGAELDLRVRCLGRTPLPFKGRVTKVIPYQGLAFTVSLWSALTPFVLDLMLAIYIDPLDKATCRHTTGLRARGLIVPAARPILEARLKRGLEHMTGLVKALAEGGAPNA